MSILVSCECGHEHRTARENAGRRGRCRACGRRLLVRGPGVYPGAHPELEDLSDLEPAPSGKAAASLALGLFSTTCGFFTGLPAVALGGAALRDIGASSGLLRGRSMAWTGIVAGLLGSVLFLAFAIVGNRPGQRAAVRRAECLAQLRRIGAAFRAYHAAEGTFPPAALAGPDGKPLLSWRVALLPYLGRGDLYRRFKLDEPWDGPHNRPLLDEMPRVFACPAPGRGPRERTPYLAVVGPGAGFEGERGLAEADFADGTSTTFLVVEAPRSVPWTKPEDLAVPPGGMPRLGSQHPGGVGAVCADGSAKVVPARIDPGTLRAYVTRAGGERIRKPF